MPLPAPIARVSLALLAALALAGCVSLGDTRAPIPTRLVQAPGPGAERVLVVVLPGRGDDLDGLASSGIAGAIQTAWPQADVLLAGASLAYYTQGQLPERLQAEVIGPARARGYSGVWLAGASLGGMGALLYERRYPGQVDGLVLLAPYLGSRGLLREIGEAGLAGWAPGAEPDAINAGNYQREVWRHVQGWTGSGRGAAVWLAYGEQDRLAPAVAVLAPALPEGQLLARPGGHAWTVWAPAAGEVFTRIRARR